MNRDTYWLITHVKLPLSNSWTTTHSQVALNPKDARDALIIENYPLEPNERIWISPISENSTVAVQLFHQVL